MKCNNKECKFYNQAFNDNCNKLGLIAKDCYYSTLKNCSTCDLFHLYSNCTRFCVNYNKWVRRQDEKNWLQGAY